MWSSACFTPQGIHIVKVLERLEMPSFESVKEELMARRAHRHGVDSGAEAQVEKLKKEYRYTPDKTGVDELINTGRTNRTLFTLAGKNYTGHDFARFAAAYPAGVRRQLDAFIMKTVLDYENTRLEQKHPDLRCLVRDYGNRLLADKITEQEIRKRAATDEA